MARLFLCDYRAGLYVETEADSRGSIKQAIKNPNLSSGNWGYRRVGATRIELVTSAL